MKSLKRKVTIMTKDQKILISGMEKEGAQDLVQLLQSWGYSGIWIQNPQKLFQAISSHQPCLGLIDLDSENNGVMEALRHLRKDSPHFPVIVATSQDSLEMERTVRALGIFYLCLKPYDPEELQLAIERATNYLEVEQALYAS
jgi:two-component system NtrC family response regulator